MSKTVGFIGGKFLPFHLGHLYTIIEAHNKVNKLYVVLSHSENRDTELCDEAGIRPMPYLVRLSWLGEAFNDLDNIEILHIEDESWDKDYDWKDGAKMITDAIPEKITHIFSSEPEYAEHFNKWYPFAEHVVIDDQRNTVTISATMLRENLYDHWNKLPSYVKSYFVKKVALVGTESVGKSTLTKKLAKFYNTNFVHEVGRDYCEKHDNQLTPEMFDLIAMEHYLLQQKLAANSDKILFVDSDAIITSYYLNMYFKTHSIIIEDIMTMENFDLYLYLEPDVEWIADGFRFAGDKEIRTLNNIMLKDQYYDPVIISGTYTERFFKARAAIDKLFI